MAKELNRLKGGIGEGIAAKYLSQKGFQIIETNWRTKYGEIDLIAADGKVLVFVEVKLKVGEDFGTPEEMINKHKIFQVRRTAEYYLLTNNTNYEQQRMDAVAIVVEQNGEVLRINHYENIDN